MEKDDNSLKIAVVGHGNVGSHLSYVLGKTYDVINVDSRQLASFPDDCALALLCVADKAIREVAEALKGKTKIIAHTSGSIPMEVLKDFAPHYGVFYPMQTFTKGVEMSYSDIPFFIEGNNRETVELLTRIASSVSSTISEADSSQRKRLHLASVFACNFSNRLVGIADSILKEGGMDYTLLLPLLRRTIQKLDILTPDAAQTGPAIRNDREVMEAHLKMLENHPAHKEIYRLLSEDIINTKNNSQ